MSYYGFPRYVSVAEKKARAEKKRIQLKKKNPGIAPIIIQGQALAQTWWGKAWNTNLEKYADYSNRIGRGRSYVRHGAVLDLQITPGKVTALVDGSRAKPYAITVTIQPMPKENWTAIKKACAGKMESMQQLIAGKFPKELAEIFTAKGSGLFPGPDEINFECSCPDWAYMCKHVAATLYGIGARLDDDPRLFFLLRKADIKDLVSETLRESTDALLSKANRKSSRVLEDSDALSDLFGIDLGGPEKSAAPPAPPAPPKKRLKKPPKKAPSKTTQGKTAGARKLPKPKTAKPAPPAKKKKTAAKTNAKTPTAAALVEEIIKTHKKSIQFAEITAKSGFDDQKVRNILYRLKKQGKISLIVRGVYQAVDE